eukprot:COSAG05_NODE_57_length_23291_cov_75.862668_43_plen_117_part_00
MEVDEPGCVLTYTLTRAHLHGQVRVLSRTDPHWWLVEECGRTLGSNEALGADAMATDGGGEVAEGSLALALVVANSGSTAAPSAASAASHSSLSSAASSGRRRAARGYFSLYTMHV